MKIIDSDNYAASGIETMFFPGGEPHVKIPKFTGEVILWLKLRTWIDVGFAACVLSAFEYQKCFPMIFIPYFPGARQDRTDGTAPLTLELMSSILDGGLHDLSVFDPHSSAFKKMCPYSRVIMPSQLDIPISKDVVGIIAPDEGATSRAFSFRDKFYPTVRLIQGHKQRNPQTGALSHYVLGDKLTEVGHYIVVDDICDGGGTFNLLAEAFAEDPLSADSSLELFVSHGIFSKGLENIDQRYKKITTTDSWCRLSPIARLAVIPLLPTFLKEIDCA